MIEANPAAGLDRLSSNRTGPTLSESVRSRVWDVLLAARGGVPAKRKRLQRWEALSRSSAVDLQRLRLEKLLHHAYENVPYYRPVFENCGVVEDGRIQVERFRNLPILGKDALRDRFDDLVSNDCSDRDWYQNTSGGSTGEPAKFVQDRDQWSWNQAVKQLLNRWTGYIPGMPRIRLWGSQRDISQSRRKLTSRIVHRLRNECLLNAFRMGADEMRGFVDTINKVRPIQILAYAESIYELARFIEAEQLEIHSPGAIMTSAGTLHPHMRRKLETVFRAPVFNRYGSREVGDMASECEAHRGLHVVEPTHFVEILDRKGRPAKSGEPGEVVVTALTAYAMPLIRYRIGDMAKWATRSCECGRPWSLIENVTGRITDNFRSPTGTMVHGAYFRKLLYGKEWVQRYQFIQPNTQSVILRVQLRDTADPEQLKVKEDLSQVKRGVRTVLGKTCKISCEFVDEIDPTASGKYRYTVSRVTPWLDKDDRAYHE